MRPSASQFSRREFTAQLLRASAAVLTAPALARAAESPALLPGSRPTITHGVASGDVTFDSAVLWSRADREARMVVEWSTRESFTDATRVIGPVTGPEADFTARLALSDLPAGQRIFYRVSFEDDGRGRSGPVTGQLLTPSRERRGVYFAWSGDTCGQGLGIDRSRGGLKTYAALRRLQPDFFIHSGDTIYADNPLQPEMQLPDGSVWQNFVTEAKSKVAETLAEFRGNHRYNLEDEHVRAFLADVPVSAQWDDHEVRNNWYPGQTLEEDPRYTVKDINTLTARARQAFFDYWPIRSDRGQRIYRNLRRGPLCELFFVDLRSHRAPNGPNRQPTLADDCRILGEAQLSWLKNALRASTATWKIICCDMPLGLLIPDGRLAWEAVANGQNGPPLGRELELANLLMHLRDHRVRNLIWLTADVHYAAAHHFSPERASFKNFDPFWEFVSGPLHAGAFGPNPLDGTFGPEVRWRSREPNMVVGGPWNQQQFFGTVRIAPETQVATVSQYNRDGDKLWSIELEPVAAA